MRILFVCTGNICRSPMGELMLAQHIQATGLAGIRVSSAGTRGLSSHVIDPSSAEILARLGIDSSNFRSQRITRELAEQSDIILCFEVKHRQQIAEVAPRAVRKTFTLTEFAQLCIYAQEHNMFTDMSIHVGQSYKCCDAAQSNLGVQLAIVQRRLSTLIAQSTLVRPMLPLVQDIADPIGQEFDYFLTVAEQTYQSLQRIINTLGM